MTQRNRRRCAPACRSCTKRRIESDGEARQLTVAALSLGRFEPHRYAELLAKRYPATSGNWRASNACSCSLPRWNLPSLDLYRNLARLRSTPNPYSLCRFVCLWAETAPAPETDSRTLRSLSSDESSLAPSIMRGAIAASAWRDHIQAVSGGRTSS